MDTMIWFGAVSRAFCDTLLKFGVSRAVVIHQQKQVQSFITFISWIRKWFEPRSNIPWLKKIIWVIEVLRRRTVVSDWRFYNLCGSHRQSQVLTKRQKGQKRQKRLFYSPNCLSIALSSCYARAVPRPMICPNFAMGKGEAWQSSPGWRGKRWRDLEKGLGMSKMEKCWRAPVFDLSFVMRNGGTRIHW